MKTIDDILLLSRLLKLITLKRFLTFPQWNTSFRNKKVKDVYNDVGIEVVDSETAIWPEIWPQIWPDILSETQKLYLGSYLDPDLSSEMTSEINQDMTSYISPDTAWYLTTFMGSYKKLGRRGNLQIFLELRSDVRSDVDPGTMYRGGFENMFILWKFLHQHGNWTL